LRWVKVNKNMILFWMWFLYLISSTVLYCTVLYCTTTYLNKQQQNNNNDEKRTRNYFPSFIFHPIQQLLFWGGNVNMNMILFWMWFLYSSTVLCGNIPQQAAAAEQQQRREEGIISPPLFFIGYNSYYFESNLDWIESESNQSNPQSIK
jgi:hypothetical protein